MGLIGYLPWPLSNIIGFLFRDAKNIEPNVCKPYPTSIFDILPVIFGLQPSIFLGYFVYITQYESLLSSAHVFEVEWMLRVLLRNVVGTLLICGIWDYILYFSPLKDALEPYKYTKKYPEVKQFYHDLVFTLCSSLMASILECFALHCWATGKLNYDDDFFGKNVKLNVGLVLFTTFWRIPHFHFIHRAMHPWRTTNFPDVGQFLYTYVHSLHHKSYNPTAFSGTSMHPVEGFAYYTAAFLPWLVCSPHPFVFIICIFDLAIGAWIGHDGFAFPGNGSYFHQLHHKHFEINYGDTMIPIDWLFGTFGTKSPKFMKLEQKLS